MTRGTQRATYKIPCGPNLFERFRAFLSSRKLFQKTNSMFLCVRGSIIHNVTVHVHVLIGCSHTAESHTNNIHSTDYTSIPTVVVSLMIYRNIHVYICTCKILFGRFFRSKVQIFYPCFQIYTCMIRTRIFARGNEFRASSARIVSLFFPQQLGYPQSRTLRTLRVGRVLSVWLSVSRRPQLHQQEGPAILRCLA